MNKKIFALIFVSLFLISFASAFDFDNVKIYDKELKQVTIKDSLLGLPTTEVATAKLNTPQINYVPVGENVKVAEFTINLQDDYYSDALKELEFFDIRKGMKEREQEFIYKKKVYIGDEKIKNYTYECENKISNNGTAYNDCIQVDNGFITQPIYEYQELNSKDLSKGEITIGIFTDVHKGDLVEWIPTFFGVRINEWAVYGAQVTDAHGVALTTSSTVQTQKHGAQFIPDCNLTIDEVGTAHLSANMNTVCLEDASFNEIQCVSVNLTRHTADFTPYNLNFTAGVTYSVVGYSGGAQYDRRSGSTSFNISGTNFNWTAGISDTSNLVDNVIFNIENMTTRCEIEDSVETYLIIPSDNLKTNNNQIEFSVNSSVSPTGIDLTNVTLYIWNNSDNSLYSTNFTSLSGNATVITNWTMSGIDDGNYTWNALTAGTLGDPAWGVNRTFTVDTLDPTINSIYPNETINYYILGNNLTLNYSITEVNPDKTIFVYNNTNYTFTGTTNSSSFQVISGLNNVTWYFNDSLGNLVTTTATWDYKIFQNNETHSQNIFETQTETYSINVTANSSLTGIFLNWNNTNYTMSNDGTGYWTYSRDTPIGVGTYNMSYLFSYAGSTINSINYTQYVNLTLFTLQNSTYPDTFLNISFKDEDDLSSINASVPTSTFTYYLGSGSVNKTLTFSNTSNNFNYAFAGTTQSNDLKVRDISFQYKQGTDYPQRIWQPEIQTYNSTDTNKILYLLNTNDGLYVTYQVLTVAESTISGVEVKSTREVSGETVQIGAGTTDSAGTITFWMNPDFQHTTTFNKTGYDFYTFIHFPTQSEYTITLGSETTVNQSCLRGITNTIKPSSDYLFESYIYDFNYTIDTDYWDLDSFGFSLTSDTGVSLGSNSSTSSSGGFMSANNINISNYTAINMNYYFTVDDDSCSQITYTRTWITQTTTGTQYGIFRWTEDFNTYVSASLFGFDNFGKTLISFVIIVLMVGGLSRRYGIASEGAIMGLLFGVVFFLDVGLNLIPKVEIGDIVSIEHFFTFITFIIMLAIIIKEERFS